MESIGEKAFRAKQIYEWLHVKLADGFDEMTNLSLGLREKLKDLDFKYNILTPDERTSKFEEYNNERVI